MVEKHRGILENFFKNYPNADECALTSDGQIFEKKAAIWAQRHADLNGLKVELVKKSDLKLVYITVKLIPAEAEHTDVVSPNISKFNKTQLIEFAKENDIEIDETATNKMMKEQIQAYLDAPVTPADLNPSVESTETEDSEESGDEFTPTNS